MSKPKGYSLERAPRVSDEEFNPCAKESVKSMTCINENFGNREACSLLFKNYKACMQFWNDVVRLRRREGIKPYLPPVHERDSVRDHYRKLWSRS